MRVSSRWGTALALALLLAVASGCGGRDGDDSDAGSAAPSGESETAAPDAGDGGGIDVDTVANQQPDVAQHDRDIVYVGSLSVAVADASEAARGARSATIAAGGRLHDEQSRGGEASATATLVLKVPPDQFYALLDELAALGDERSRTVSAEDVTAEVVDLESRIKSAQASVDRTRALLAETKDIGDVVVVESELAQREAALEQLLGQQRVIEASIAMATITLDVFESAEVVVAADDGDGGLPGPLEALESGAHSVVAVFSIVLVVLAVALPWVPVALVALGIAWHVRRRRTPAATTTTS
jgi:hypothetical protein